MAPWACAGKTYAEDVPTEIVKAFINEAQLMESMLYKSIFAQGEAQTYANPTVQR